MEEKNTHVIVKNPRGPINIGVNEDNPPPIPLDDTEILLDDVFTVVPSFKKFREWFKMLFLLFTLCSIFIFALSHMIYDVMNVIFCLYCCYDMFQNRRPHNIYILILHTTFLILGLSSFFILRIWGLGVFYSIFTIVNITGILTRKKTHFVNTLPV